MDDRFINGVSGVILAGGKSRRYGQNKALVNINGIPLIKRVLGVMENLFSSTVVITNTPDTYSFLNLPMFEDRIKGLGPLGGIFTGLNVISEKAGFFVACDMPFLNPHLIRYLVMAQESFDVVVPTFSGKFEALHALYTQNCLPEIEQMIRAGVYQTIQLYHAVSVRYVEEREIRRFDPELKSFSNINKPEELRKMALKSLDC
ncbi:MAG: molybdenum cofactor guanylyltransferase [Deltaproteobacteria bacterium]|nr:molybdenum cofactor guanylyltransferase [Deltaproteobacteria bacterium]